MHINLLQNAWLSIRDSGICFHRWSWSQHDLLKDEVDNCLQPLQPTPSAVLLNPEVFQKSPYWRCFWHSWWAFLRFLRGSFIFTLPLFGPPLHPPGETSDFFLFGLGWTVLWNSSRTLYTIFLHPPLGGRKSKSNVKLWLLFGEGRIHQINGLSLMSPLFWLLRLG